MLGPFYVAIDGSPVEDRRWSRRKPALLLKLLALQPHQQLHREQAMELLWPALEPESAGNNLHKAIHLARRALEPALSSAAASHFILTQGQQIALRAPGRLWIDVVEFEQRAAEAVKSQDAADFEAALALYGGDLLSEDPYEDWLALRREQLRAIHHELLMELARRHETRGQFQQGIQRLKELVSADAANEEAHRQLMRLYALVGSRQQALRQYKECCAALRRELAAEPEPATRELHAQIVAGRIRSLANSQERNLRGDASINSLAVLPLANASADPAMEYLSDGITESIINNLSQLRGLRVMAHSTVEHYKEREVDPQEIGRQLNARAVLTGRVSQHSDHLTIRTELVDATDGSRLWGEQYNRPLADIFAVQEEIAREIAEKLRLRLTNKDKGRLTRRHTESVAAYHAYLKGRYFWNKRTTKWIKKGAEHFQQAIEIDPAYAAAYAGLSDSYTNLVTWEALSPTEGLPQAKAAAIAALKFDETFAEAYASLAHARLHLWEWAEAEQAFRRAIELNPAYAPARSWYAEYLAAVGHFAEALAEAERAHELDPLSLFMSSDVGWVLYLARRYDEAIEQYRKTLEMEPNFFLARYQLGQVYAQKGMYGEALDELRQAVELTSGSALAALLVGYAYAVSGKRSEARDALDRLSQLSERKYFSPYRVATINAGLGETAQAFEWLERAYEKADAWLIWLKVDPALDGLRAAPRFQDLLRRVGLTR